MPKTIHQSQLTVHYDAARLYHSTASVWLSVDPLSDKYPSVSPYVYCAGNPVRLVDPDGREIGDYFDYKGGFLGTDGIDDGKVYIVSSEHWDEIKNSGFVDDYGTTTISSSFINADGFSDWFQKPSETNLSNDAVFNIISHYNNTDKPTVKGTSAAMRTEFSPNTGALHIQINGEKWANNNFIDNYFNILSTYDNETGHIKQFNEIGFDRFVLQNPYEKEKYAVDYQKQQLNFAKSSPAYQKWTDAYLQSKSR